MQTIARFFTILALAALPLSAQPFLLSPPAIGPTHGDVLGAGAASNGKEYVVAWAESRLGVAQVRFARFGVDGVPADPQSTLISSPSEIVVDGDISAPSVATDGLNFIVVWAARSRLHTVWLPAGGAPLITTTPVEARSASVVWAGNAYIVLTETTVAAVLTVAALDFDSRLLKGDVQVTVSRAIVSSPSLAVNKSGRPMALWLDSWDGDAHIAEVSLARVLSGVITSQVLQSPKRAVVTALIASDGDFFLAMWTTDPVNPASNAFDLLARPLNSGGTPSGPVVTVASSIRPIHPILFWNGQKYLLVLSDPTGGVTARGVNFDGSTDPAGPYLLTEHSASSKEAQALVAGDLFGANKTFLIWRDFRFAHTELFGQVGGTDARSISDEIVVSRSPATQKGKAAVWTGADYLGVWTEAAGITRIMAARANERVPIIISGPQFTRSAPSDPAVAAAGGKAVIVWLDVPPTGSQQSALYRAVLQNGALAASTPATITIDVRHDQPSIATNGQTFAVAWTTFAGEIAVTTIDASGTSAATPVTLTVKPSDTLTYSSPRLAWIGNLYVLAWLRTLSVDGRIIVELQRLSPSLTPIGSPIPLTDTSTSSSLSVASGPSGALVTWTLHTAFNEGVRAARFLSSTSLADPPLPPGTLLDPINGVTVVPGSPANGATAAWDGKAWRIGVDDALVSLPESGGVQLSQTIPTATRIAAIAGGGPRLFIVFDVDDTSELTTRVFGQLLNEVPLRHRAVKK